MKLYIYYLAEASVAGQDIIIDQNFKYNITLRNTFQALVKEYAGDRDCNEWRGVEHYAKQLWFSNGIHHHYSGEKFMPLFWRYFADAIRSVGSHINLDDTQHLSIGVYSLSHLLYSIENSTLSHHT